MRPLAGLHRTQYAADPMPAGAGYERALDAHAEMNES